MSESERKLAEEFVDAVFPGLQQTPEEREERIVYVLAHMNAATTVFFQPSPLMERARQRLREREP